MDNINSLKTVLNTMNELIELLSKKGINKDSLINSFIDGFVCINEQINNRITDIDDLHTFEEMENTLVRIVRYYNENNVENANLLIEETLLSQYPQWKQVSESYLHFNIIICGINIYSPMFHSVLDKSEFNVIGYLNIPEINKEYETLNGIPILSVNELHQYVYDYIVILSQGHEEVELILHNFVEKEKIINYLKYAVDFASIYNKLYNSNYGFSFVHSNLEKAKNDPSTEVIISGMSYSLHGVDTNCLFKNGAKLCWASQDIYYDYLLTKEAIIHNQNIKYCIIGMSYFSFDIDLSQLKTQNYLIDQIYYPILNDSHHYSRLNTYNRPKGIDSIDEFISIPKPFNSITLVKSFLSATQTSMNSELNESIWNQPCENIPLDWLGQKRARLHGDSNYPETVKENKDIFKSFLSLLTDRTIKPIIIIFPTSSSYYPYSNPDLKLRFYNIMNQLKSEYNFSIHDFFDNHLFDTTDFADSDHLNKKGAAKMTEILNTLLI